ncbi:MAG: hypothetical protein K6A36_06385 [Paludibacteraceae bacterium]|nr:hypothetical protein [Paludibacteraceae bacterium]
MVANTRFNHIFLSLLLISLGLHAQQFNSTSSAYTATINQPTYNNVFLHSAGSQSVAVWGGVVGDHQSHAATSGTNLFSGSILTSKRKYQQTTTGYSGIAGISAYQNISTDDIGLSSPAMRIGPPPPTPHPEDEDINKQLPIGDAWWLLLLLAGGYGLAIFRRQNKAID